MQTVTSSYRLQPIPPDTADELRRRGGPIYVADEVPGFPCRGCLRDAEVGDELILVSHDPFTVDSPYRSASPIFLHRERCEPPANLDTVPLQLERRLLSVRAFDTDAMMIDAAVVEGMALEDTIERFFADTATDRIHIHNANRGCWAVTVERG